MNARVRGTTCEGEDSCAAKSRPLVGLVRTPAAMRKIISSAPGIAATTRRELASDLRSWVRFARESRFAPSLPATSNYFVAWLAWQAGQGLAPATVKRRACSLSKLHTLAGLRSPAGELSAGLIRALAPAAQGGRPPARRAMTLEIVARALDTGGLGGVTLALVLIGLAAGLTRTEIVALEWGHVTITSTAARLTIGRRTVVIDASGPPLCAAVALADLQPSDNPPSGARVFGVSGATVARMVKRVAVLAGEDPAGFSVKSLRAGHRAQVSS